MRNHLARRLGQAVLVLWAAYTLSFILLSALPGDAITTRIQNPDSDITPEGAQALLAFYGLDRPLWEQYGRGLLAAVQGDLGYSLNTGRPVTEMISEALPSTLQLTVLGLAFGIVIAVVVALAINYAHWGWLRSLVSSAPALFGSVPTFVVGILLLQIFAFQFGVIPSVDDGSFRALIAPAVTLGIVLAATLAQVFATSIRSTRNQPFAHVQQAKGAGEGYIFRKDVLRNSALPVLTLLGLAFGELLAGAVVTEAVFARGGIGQLVVGSVNGQDLPVVQGVVLLSAVAYVAINLLVDLAYPFIDPRILVDGKQHRGRRRHRRQHVQPTAAAGRSATTVEAGTPRLPAEAATQ
jgi:peptide/nickel transport system permease protein